VNGRTAKLIRRAATATNLRDKDIKRSWRRLSSGQRTEARKEMRRKVAAYRAAMEARE